MSRVAALAGATLVLVATTALAAARPAAREAGTATPTAVGIAQREFHMTAYRRVVKRGPVKFNITNLGEDTHNLVIRGPRRFNVVGPDVDAGERATLTTRLRRRGTYSLLCTRANHLSLGMRTKLVVRR
jgi:plastocyanin